MDLKKHEGCDSLASAVWNPDIVTVIAEHLSPNVVACNLRLVNKETLALVDYRNIVTLSQPVPEHAFAWYLGFGNALSKYNQRQRVRFLSATATSGSLSNLKLLLRTTVRYLTGEDVDPDEVPGDKMWGALKQYGGYSDQDFRSFMYSPASVGQGEVCKWMLAHSCPMNLAEASLTAARGGHLGLMEELRRAPGVEVRAADLLAAVAEGCGLPDLTRLYEQELQQGEGGEVIVWGLQSMLAAAAASPTLDWQPKVEWFEAQWPNTLNLLRSQLVAVTTRVASSRLADSAERLAWLRGRGYPLDSEMFLRTARTGNTPALTYLLDTLGAPSDTLVATTAAEAGHLGVLQLLHARGCPMPVPSILQEAVFGGHVHIITWLMEVFGVEDQQLRGMSWAATYSGSLPLLRWMHACECLQTVACLVEGSFSEEMMEWMVEHGCRVQGDVTPEDLATLRFLERLGWRPPEESLKRILERTVRRPLSGPTLRWLRDQGAMPPVTQETLLDWVRGGGSLCTLRWLEGELAGGPVDWEAVLGAAVKAGGPEQQNKEVVEWIRGRLQGQ